MDPKKNYVTKNFTIIPGGHDDCHIMNDEHEHVIIIDV